MDPNPKGPRKRSKKNVIHPNPLFEKWLLEVQREAEERESNNRFCYAKALKSLRKYPLLLRSGLECKILRSFGPKLCKMIDRKLARFKESNPDEYRTYLALSESDSFAAVTRTPLRKTKSARSDAVTVDSTAVRTNKTSSESNGIPPDQPLFPEAQYSGRHILSATHAQVLPDSAPLHAATTTEIGADVKTALLNATSTSSGVYHSEVEIELLSAPPTPTSLCQVDLETALFNAPSTGVDHSNLELELLNAPSTSSGIYHPDGENTPLSSTGIYHSEARPSLPSTPSTPTSIYLPDAEDTLLDSPSTSGSIYHPDPITRSEMNLALLNAPSTSTGVYHQDLRAALLDVPSTSSGIYHHNVQESLLNAPSTSTGIYHHDVQAALLNTPSTSTGIYHSDVEIELLSAPPTPTDLCQSDLRTVLLSTPMSASTYHLDMDIELLNSPSTSTGIYHSAAGSALLNAPSTSSGIYHPDTRKAQLNKPYTSAGSYHSDLRSALLNAPSTSSGIYRSDAGIVQNKQPVDFNLDTNNSSDLDLDFQVMLLSEWTSPCKTTEASASTLPTTSTAFASTTKKEEATREEKRKLEATHSSYFSKFILPAGCFEIKLLVDTAEISGFGPKHHEPLVLAELRRMNIKFEIRHLNVGDFTWICQEIYTNKEAILPYIVERKRMDDFGKSIKDGRFHEQKFRLKKSGCQHLIYLVENHGNNRQLRLPLTTIEQATANTQVIDDFTIMRTLDQLETIEYLCCATNVITKRYKDKMIASCPKECLAPVFHKSDTISLMDFKDFNAAAKKKTQYTVREMFIKQLVQLHGMSVSKATATAQIYPSPSKLMQAYDKGGGEALLSNITYGKAKRKIGPALSKIIYEFYTCM